jgi:hypothetical protein
MTDSEYKKINERIVNLEKLAAKEPYCFGKFSDLEKDLIKSCRLLLNTLEQVTGRTPCQKPY